MIWQAGSDDGVGPVTDSQEKWEFSSNTETERRKNRKSENFFPVGWGINQILTWSSPNKNSRIKRSDWKIYFGCELTSLQTTTNQIFETIQSLVLVTKIQPFHTW